MHAGPSVETLQGIKDAKLFTPTALDAFLKSLVKVMRAVPGSSASWEVSAHLTSPCCAALYCAVTLRCQCGAVLCCAVLCCAVLRHVLPARQRVVKSVSGQRMG
jgi:hypothetical protein